MPRIPYESSAASNVVKPSNDWPAMSPLTIIIKCVSIIGGMLLYLTNFPRDAYFFLTIQENEGFTTPTDAVMVGIAGSLISTIVYSPVALVLIAYGFGRCSHLQLLPRFDRFTIGWGSFASVLMILMLMIESNYLIYSIQRTQHWKTMAASLFYIGYIYFWWCCSIAHAWIPTNNLMNPSSGSSVS